MYTVFSLGALAIAPVPAFPLQNNLLLHPTSLEYYTQEAYSPGKAPDSGEEGLQWLLL